MEKFYNNLRNATGALPTRGSMQIERRQTTNSQNNSPYKTYSNIVDDITFPTTGSEGETKKSNSLVFRNANKEEKTGLQKITLLDKGGKEHSYFLVVPERESVGYGEIRGWNSPGDQNMPLTKNLWFDTIDSTRGKSEGGKAFSEGAAALATPFTAAADLIGGNTIMNNITKNERSNYTGEDKAVGLGEEGQSQGQILGMIDENNERLNAQETEYFLKNLEKNGFVAMKDFEKPTKVQEHTGPAYVPGDILLGFLGLQPNRGSVGYTFKTYENNKGYQDFLRNLREVQRRK